jgi:hypothetical protein
MLMNLIIVLLEGNNRTIVLVWIENNLLILAMLCTHNRQLIL